MKRPKKSEYAPFHGAYVSLVPKGTAVSLLKKTFKEAEDLFGALPEEKGDYAYAEGKWTVKQVLAHLIDAERIFSFRALWFIRGDRAPLPGFNQDHWMEQCEVSGRSIKDLMKEWKTARTVTLQLAAQCSEEQSQFVGTAGTWKVSTRSWFYIIIGHQIHHMNFLRSNYFNDIVPASN